MRAALVVFALFLIAAPASAQSVIKRPGAHPDYVFEAEPHLAFGLFHRHDVEEGFGPGFRGTIEIVDNGFISKINNTVGIGFGLDWLFHGGHCHGRRGGPNVGCNEHDHDRLIFPVVMQWNFWLTQEWSVFGEPGFALELVDDHDRDDLGDDDDKDLRLDPFVFFAGGRYHFTDAISLTMRVGWPYFSVGASFFL